MYTEKVNINDKVEFIPIDVVATIYKDGRIQPSRFRVEGSSGRRYSFSIESVHQVDNTSYVGVARRIFTCSVLVAGEAKVLKLRYTLDTARWALVKDKKLQMD